MLRVELKVKLIEVEIDIVFEVVTVVVMLWDTL